MRKKKINSKQKGKRGELEVAHIFSSAGFPTRRGVQYSGGKDSPDVVVDIISDYFHFEVKNTSKLQIGPLIQQMKRDAEFKVPIGVFKLPQYGWNIVMNFQTFLDLLQVLLESESGGNILGTVVREIREERRKREEERIKECDKDTDLL